jgi:uncharacterized delta-60 repeat protein
MSLVPLGFWAASGGGISYWLATLGGTSSDFGRSVAVDSSGNVYAFGDAGTDSLLAKYDPAGTTQWQQALGSADSNSVAIDSSDNIYTVGWTSSAGEGSRDFLVARYNSSGTIQWQRVLGGTGFDLGSAVAVDSSGNVYAFGYTTSQGAGGSDFLIAKYNSSGTIQWQRTLGGSNSESGYGVAVDSSDNVYVFGETQSAGAGGLDFLLAKYNSSGTIQWQRILGGSGREDGHAVAIDSSDNVYVLGYTGSTGAGASNCLLAKYNSSGTIQWQRVLGGSGNDKGFAVAFDSSDNVYLSGSTDSTGAGDDDFLLAKYNSSGTIQWQRTLGGLGRDEVYAVAVDSSDNLYVLGYTGSTGAGGTDFLIAKLPNDGSLTGTYSLDGVDVIYAASSLTAATSTLTAATSSLTSASSSLTSAISTLTAASASLTSHLVEL